MKRLVLIVVLYHLILSCSKYNENNMGHDNSSEYKYITMTIPACEFYETDDTVLETKNVAVVEDSKVKFVWSEDDVVGIFPDKGSQIYFSMAAGAGQTSASFDGGGWALKAGSSYYSYFPFIPDFYIDKTAIPLTYTGQKQIGNADPNRAELGNYGYMVAKGEADIVNGSLYFDYKRLSVIITAMIPVKSGTYKSLTIKTEDDVIVQSGTTNVVDYTLSVDNAKCGNSLKLDLEDAVFSSDGTLVAHILVSPFNILNKQLTFELKDAQNVSYMSSIRARDYKTTTKYTHEPHFTVSPGIIDIAGSSQTFNIDILLKRDGKAYPYTIESDVDWLTIGSSTGNASGSVSVIAAKNPGGKRVGHVVISETVNVGTANETLLKNVVTVRQYADGLTVEPGEWEDSGEDYGGSAH